MDDLGRQPNILIWDIESTGLNATFGTILCIGWKWFDSEEVTVRTILDGRKKDMLDDRAVVAAFVKEFEKCDYHITWYGDRFDLPMIRHKMIKHGMPPLVPKISLDLWRNVRRLFKSHSNRLNVWEQVLQVADRKTPLDFDAWLQAAHGDRASIEEVREHCRLDVLVLEEVFRKLRPWIDNEPINGLFSGEKASCTSCGSLKVQRRGYKVAATRTYPQYCCQECGHWFRDTRAAVVSPVRSIG